MGFVVNEVLSEHHGPVVNEVLREHHGMLSMKC